jgi:hypothetical protein
MKLRNQFEFLFVGKEEGSFLENYAYDLGEGEEAAGQLFVTIEIQNNPADAEVIAETIFDSARKIFFSDLEKDTYERFEDALKEVNTQINKFKEDTVSKFIGNLHVIIGVVAGSELHVSQTGDAEAYLVRKRYCSVISEGLSDPTAKIDETFSNIASGSLEPGDFVIFSTTRLLRYVSKTDFINMLKSSDLVESLSDLKDALTPEILSKISVIGMVFHEGLSELSTTEKKGVREYLEDEKPGLVKRLKSKPNVSLGFLKTFWDKVMHYFNAVLVGMTSKRMTKDKILALLIIVIVLLTLVIFFIKNSGANQREIERLDQILVQVQEEINTAKMRGISNKDAAAEILAKAESQAIEVLNSGHHRSKANELLGKIQEEKSGLDNITYVTDPKMIADLTTKRDNVSALGLIPYKDHVFAFEYNALYEILLDQIENPLTIDDNETVIDGTWDDDNDLLVFITKSGKVISYDNGQFEFMDTEDGEFRKGVAVESYNGRIYVLDNEGKQIWKYTRRRDQYSAAESYIAEGEFGANFVDLAIDGFIYVILDDGNMLQFDRGVATDFNIAKAPLDPIETPTKIYTELDLNKIFVLETSKNRVIVLDKDLNTGDAVYNGQLVFDNIGDVRDLYYDKDSQRLYLLDTQRLFEVIL